MIPRDFKIHWRRLDGVRYNNFEPAMVEVETKRKTESTFVEEGGKAAEGNVKLKTTGQQVNHGVEQCAISRCFRPGRSEPWCGLQEAGGAARSWNKGSEGSLYGVWCVCKGRRFIEENEMLKKRKEHGGRRVKGGGEKGKGGMVEESKAGRKAHKCAKWKANGGCEGQSTKPSREARLRKDRIQSRKRVWRRCRGVCSLTAELVHL